MKKNYTVFSNGEAKEVFDNLEDAEHYIFVWTNPDKTAKPDHWEVGEYNEDEDGLGWLVKMHDYGEGL